ncbi:hypothetical protein Tc00.1047053510377.120 [Trypanosoma cruzi]|uniref:Uncharacterized protein n=1 Tax=Trypanosoma cruzi (strain CL Brener) TaxID=353153 RepID=Q4E3V6_TRYCC|nr:hypothetical protein Tc00.1047053510377.120 [Trypanosoma cruzi]EAN99447.1 hypothetical protein Tc00.1047053510377.120 [Trypanosoma cruzi]|eukprot:XP_821298.1 hypothetical protein [Trypanosoma cruzi strain CL Brener]
MSLSGPLLVASAMHLRCTFFASLYMLCSSFLLLRFVFLQAHTTTHAQDAHCSGFECFFCSACWQLRVAAFVFLRGHEENGGGEGVRSPRLLSCGCGAPRVTALSLASCPIEGGMAGKFGAASWMDEGPLSCGWCGGCSLRVRCVVAAGFGHFPLAVEMSWEEMVVDIFSCCMVGGCWRCMPSLRGCRLVVCELCGWACCPLLMLSALSRCIRCAPSLSLLLHSFPSVSPIS